MRPECIASQRKATSFFREDTTTGKSVIEINSGQKFQQIEGFGASVTGSSA
jgi:O-glycosyl hydrolase